MNWEAVSAIGTWVGGIATFAAVVVALITARESKAIKLRVSVGIGYMPKGEDLIPAHVVYSAYNNGYRPVRLTHIGVKLPNQAQVILSMNHEGDRPPYVEGRLPAYLMQSDGVNIVVPIEEFAEALVNNGCKTESTIETFWIDIGNKYYYSELKFNPQEFLEAKK
jgi:hypothetical protein